MSNYWVFLRQAPREWSLFNALKSEIINWLSRVTIEKYRDISEISNRESITQRFVNLPWKLHKRHRRIMFKAMFSFDKGHGINRQTKRGCALWGFLLCLTYNALKVLICIPVVPTKKCQWFISDQLITSVLCFIVMFDIRKQIQ